MPSLLCTRCGEASDPSYAFCGGCGSPLRPSAPAERHCVACGARLEARFRFCGHCGTAVAPRRPTPAPAAVPDGAGEARAPAAAGGPAEGSARAPEPAPAPARAPPAPAIVPAAAAGPAGALPGSVDPDAVSAAFRGGRTGERRAVRIVPVRHDGLPGTVHKVGAEGLVCGRAAGALRFPEDATVSPEHARITVQGEGAAVEDLGSATGTFLRVREPRPLAPGDEVRLGRQLLRFDPMAPPAEGAAARPWGSRDPGYEARLTQLLEGGGTGEVFPLVAGEHGIGREGGSVAFPADRYVSARHARLEVSDRGAVLSDVGSSNGTFVRIRGAAPIAPGDQLLLGMQLLRVES